MRLRPPPRWPTSPSGAGRANGRSCGAKSLRQALLDEQIYRGILGLDRLEQ